MTITSPGGSDVVSAGSSPWATTDAGRTAATTRHSGPASESLIVRISLSFLLAGGHGLGGDDVGLVIAVTDPVIAA